MLPSFYDHIADSNCFFFLFQKFSYIIQIIMEGHKHEEILMSYFGKWVMNQPVFPYYASFHKG